MKPSWPKVRLGEVLQRSEEVVIPTPGTQYRELTVRLWGRGVIERGRLDGASLAGSRRYLARAGQFIASRIDARNGAMGIVPDELDGALVTNDFPLFNLRTDRLVPAYFEWLSRTQGFVELCQRGSEGSTNRVRLKEDRFLALDIPLPPLAEQHRVVARIEELAAEIDEARALRRQTAPEVEALLITRAGQLFARIATQFVLREFGSFSPHVTSGPRNWGSHYDQNGLRFYRAQDIGHNGQVLNDSRVFVAPPAGEQGRSAMLQRGDLMLVITGATVGRVSVFRDGLELGLVSQHVAICRLPADQVDPEFALWGLRSHLGRAQLLGQRYGQGKPGLNLSNIRALRLPFPPLPEQRRTVVELDGLQAKVQQLKALQAETAAELDALLAAVLNRTFEGEV